MATVQDLVNRVAKLGLGEDEPDAAEQALYLSFIQASHNQLYGEVAESDVTTLLDSEDVTVTNGSGALAARPFIIKTVVDIDNKRALDPTDVLTLVKERPLLDATGKASRFYQKANAIKLDTNDSITARVWRMPMPQALTLTTNLSDLYIPEPYVDVLLWGALLQLAYDERDKGLVVEMQLCARMYDTFHGGFWNWLVKNQVREDLFVKPCMP